MKPLKSLIAAAVLFSTMSVFAQQPPSAACVTNLTVTALSPGQGTHIYVSGSTNYSIVDYYTNVTGMDLIAQDCDDGCVLTFAVGQPCPTSPTDVARVSWDCSQISCGGGTCQGGGSFTITMPPCIGMMWVRIFSRYGCCTMTYCTAYAGANCCGDPQP